jgi:hypothetical protein
MNPLVFSVDTVITIHFHEQSASENETALQQLTEPSKRRAISFLSFSGTRENSPKNVYAIAHILLFIINGPAGSVLYWGQYNRRHQSSAREATSKNPRGSVRMSDVKHPLATVASPARSRETSHDNG